MSNQKHRAAQNRTLFIRDEERDALRQQIQHLHDNDSTLPVNSIINADCCQVVEALPRSSVDLLILDPPYNLTKNYNGDIFKAKDTVDYISWFETWFAPMMQVLKPSATVYICCDWKTSQSIYTVAKKYLHIRNRITWEREKGRGAMSNWKNCSEDVWFCTVSNRYTFHADAVRTRKKVVAPYRENGVPKDWEQTVDGKYRDTAPSNLWTDISIPFWSMPENTDHPTQKPEKLIAKLLLASSNEGDIVLDPFSGSGTTAVVAKKLNRKYICIEQEEEYCLLAAKRLQLAEKNRAIQGLSDGIFWDRNML